MGDTAHSPALTPTEIGNHRDALYRFAMLRLRNAAAAEDVVQATLLAALQAHSRFRGDAAPRTWLIGILKRKIIDHVREEARSELSLDGISEEAGVTATDFADLAFRSDGSWVARPSTWPDPESALADDGFLAAVQSGLDGLPAHQRRAFLLREVDGLEPEEVCAVLAISRANYWVLMHRARLRLRASVESHWRADADGCKDPAPVASNRRNRPLPSAS